MTTSSGGRARGRTPQGLVRARSPWYVRPRGRDWPTVAALCLASAALTWLVWRTSVDGSPTGFVHLFYLTVVTAAVRFGAVAAVSAAGYAGLVAGPWLPAQPTDLPSLTGGPQPAGEWAVRLGTMVVVAVAAAWLTRQQPRPIEDIVRDARLARALRAAVAAGRVGAHYQVIVDLADGRSVGAEALARWTDRSGNPVRPDVFIPVAERSGAVLPLGRHVLGLAMRQAEVWAAAGYPPRPIAVNVSAAQLGDPDFVGDLAQAVESWALAPELLCLEITETAIIAEPGAALATVRAAHDLGVRIALDDFGTGQSSLAYLADFPIDIVKIDKSFVDSVDTDPKVHTLVLAIIEMAKALEAVTVAEGIERASQLQALRLLGCDLGQGYHLARPAPGSTVVLGARVVEPASPARAPRPRAPGHRTRR